MRALYRAATAAAAASIVASSLLLPLPAYSIMPFQQVSKNEVKVVDLSFSHAKNLTPPVCQYETVGGIPNTAFKKNRIIYGRVEKIIDGDTIRVR
jgi:hypothetical protein